MGDDFILNEINFSRNKEEKTHTQVNIFGLKIKKKNKQVKRATTLVDVNIMINYSAFFFYIAEEDRIVLRFFLLLKRGREKGRNI